MLAPRPDLNESALEPPKRGRCGEVASSYWILVKLKPSRLSSAMITKFLCIPKFLCIAVASASLQQQIGMIERLRALFSIHEPLGAKPIIS
jgi:hypothetical protein